MSCSSCCFGFLGGGGAAKPRKQSSVSAGRSADPSTLSEVLGPGRARVLHRDLDLTVDFVGQRLLGHVDLHSTCNAEAPADGKWELVLDASESLMVHAVMVDGQLLMSSQWSRDEARRNAT